MDVLTANQINSQPPPNSHAVRANEDVARDPSTTVNRRYPLWLMSPAKTRSRGAMGKTVDSLMPRLKSELRSGAHPLDLRGWLSTRSRSRCAQFVAELLRDAGVRERRTARSAEYVSDHHRRDPRARQERRRSCSTGTTMSCPQVTSRSGQSPPFEPTERHGAIYGRGSSDSKANVMAHVGALRAYSGKPPVGIKVVIEGQEEVGSAFNTYPPLDPERFRCDAMVIADMGSVRPGVPTLTVALRGTAVVTVEVKTLAGPKHSGQYGGAAPDALLVLLRALRRCTTTRATWPCLACGARNGPARRTARTNSASLRSCSRDAVHRHRQPGERLWSGPAITVTGMDVLPVDKAVNAVVAVCASEDQPPRPSGAGRRRGAAGAHRPSQETAAVRHRARCQAGATGNGFAAKTSGPAYDAARTALASAWGGKTVSVATGGSIPLVNALHTRRAGCRDPAASGRRTASAISTRRMSGSFSMSSGRR